MFNVGDRAVYPAHGIGVIQRIETRDIGGAARQFYVFQTYQGSTLMVPVLDAARAGLRPILTASEVGELIARLRRPVSGFQHTTWIRRFRELNDQLRTGDAGDVVEVLRSLHALRQEKDLSYGEAKMRDKALHLLSDEICHATGVPIDECEGNIHAALSYGTSNQSAAVKE